MLKCPNCGKLNNSSAKFCRYCGTKLSISKTASNNKGTRSSKIKCPRCGELNDSTNKFCINCGYTITKQQPYTNNQNRYYDQWNRANQSISTVSNSFNEYFQWFKNTLVHPMDDNHTNPYFGIISFSIMAFFIWISEILGESNSHVMDDINSLVMGYSPLKVYINDWQNAETPIGMFILSFISVAIYVLAGCIGQNLISSSSDDLFSEINKMASLLNVNVIFSIFLIVGSLISVDTLSYYVQDLISTLFTIGIAYLIITTKHKKQGLVNSIYIAVLMSVCADIVQGIIVAIVGMMMA